MKSDEETRNPATPARASAEIVPPTTLQLKRLTRDLHKRTAEFARLMQVALPQSTPLERAACRRLLADVNHMRQKILLAGEIAQASMAAIARQDPAELIALRDELLSYMALFDVIAAPPPHNTEITDNDVSTP